MRPSTVRRRVHLGIATLVAQGGPPRLRRVCLRWLQQGPLPLLPLLLLVRRQMLKRLQSDDPLLERRLLPELLPHGLPCMRPVLPGLKRRRQLVVATMWLLLLHTGVGTVLRLLRLLLLLRVRRQQSTC